MHFFFSFFAVEFLSISSGLQTCCHFDGCHGNSIASWFGEGSCVDYPVL